MISHKSNRETATSPVTKETARMTPFSRFHRISPSFSSSAATTPVRGDDRATRAAAMASAGPSEARTQGGGVAALLTRLRTQHRAVSAAVSVVAIGVGAFSIATPAQADPLPYEIKSFTSRTTDAADANYTQAGGHPFQNRTAFEFTSYLSGFSLFPPEELKGRSSHPGTRLYRQSRRRPSLPN